MLKTQSTRDSLKAYVWTFWSKSLNAKKHLHTCPILSSKIKKKKLKESFGDFAKQCQIFCD